MRRTQDADPPVASPDLHGLAACLALLELEARSLDRPLVALLIAAAGEALQDRPAVPRLSAPASPPPG